MKCSFDRVIKSRHKGLSRKEFNRGGVGILLGLVGSSRTSLDCRKARQQSTGPQPRHTVGKKDWDITHLFSLLVVLH